MFFSESSYTELDPFINAFGKCNKATINQTDSLIFRKTISRLYKDIYDAYSSINIDEFNVDYNNYPIVMPEIITKTKFLDTEIHAFLTDTDNKIKQIHVSHNINNFKVDIFLNLFPSNKKVNINQCITYIITWLTLCSKYTSAKCIKSLTLYVFFTPFKKKLPGALEHTLGAKHVNSGVTNSCKIDGEIVVYREEEWFKVFIHETMHAFGFDFSNTSMVDVKNKMVKIFNIDSDFLIYEAYSETWARLLNCIFCGFKNLKNKKDEKSFIINVDFCFELERKFSSFMSVKILDFMKCKYIDLIESNKNDKMMGKYRENSNVLAYYVITSIFMNSYQEFVVWCDSNDLGIVGNVEFSNDKIYSFIEFIHKYRNCETMNKLIGVMEQIYNESFNINNESILGQSTRMTIISTL